MHFSVLSAGKVRVYNTAIQTLFTVNVSVSKTHEDALKWVYYFYSTIWVTRKEKRRKKKEKGYWMNCNINKSQIKFTPKYLTHQNITHIIVHITYKVNRFDPIPVQYVYTYTVSSIKKLFQQALIVAV